MRQRLHVRGRKWACAPALALACLLGAAPDPAAAQERPYSPHEERWRDASWPDEVGFAAANALVGGVASAIVAALRDDVPVGRAFVAGALGGLGVYAGKRLASARFPAAGLIGRQVASLGSSVGRNAADGRDPFQEIVVPLGVVRLYWDRFTGQVRGRPDLNAIGWVARAAFEPRLDLSWSHSLSAGAPVFLVRGATFENGAAGRALGSVILADPDARVPLEDILAHERVHVLQLDQHFSAWGEPLEGWAVGLLGPPVAGVTDRVDMVLPTIVTGVGLGTLWPGAWSRNPLENEAYFLQMRSRRAPRRRRPESEAGRTRRPARRG